MAPAKSAEVVVDGTVVVGVTGVVVSGVVGPWVAARLSRKADRVTFVRDREGQRRDGLRDILDEAATLMGAAMIHVGALEKELKQSEAWKRADEWQQQVFPMGVRLQLWLSGDHPVVTAYEAAREKLVIALHSKAGPERDAATDTFEAARNVFLEVSRSALDAPIDEGDDP